MGDRLPEEAGRLLLPRQDAEAPLAQMTETSTQKIDRDVRSPGQFQRWVTTEALGRNPIRLQLALSEAHPQRPPEVLAQAPRLEAGALSLSTTMTMLLGLDQSGETYPSLRTFLLKQRCEHPSGDLATGPRVERDTASQNSKRATIQTCET
mmetsp:Transcript_21369/g.45698  ORF Transcript_21369/g.45698 Transcript_21369/m.45698 type:complete len:151 (+) Transcript_21369:711-1163(+)